MLQHESLSMRCSPSPMRDPLSTDSTRILLQHRLPLESQPPSDILLLWHRHLQGLQIDLCTPLSSRSSATSLGCTTESQLWSLEQLFLLLPCPGCLQSSSSHIHTPLFHPLLCSTFYTFLNMWSQRCYQCCRRAQPWPASRSMVELREASGIFSQKSPLQSTPSPKPCHTNLTLL